MTDILTGEPSRNTNDDQTARKEHCDREFERYYKERDEWVKSQLDAERSYDALLVTISTLALGASLAKPPETTAGSFSQIVLIIGWVAFVVCLLVSLAHRYLTYYTHKQWVEVVDAEFSCWEPKAFERAIAKYDAIPFIKRVESLKLIAGGAVTLGVVSFLLFLFASSGSTATTNNATTQPAANFTPVITITNNNGVPTTRTTNP